MELINKITDWAKSLLGLVGVLFGLAVFSELLFGKFLGEFSDIANFIDTVGKFGSAGFVGLIALLVILQFINKK